MKKSKTKSQTKEEKRKKRSKKSRLKSQEDKTNEDGSKELAVRGKKSRDGTQSIDTSQEECSKESRPKGKGPSTPGGNSKESRPGSKEQGRVRLSQEGVRRRSSSASSGPGVKEEKSGGAKDAKDKLFYVEEIVNSDNDTELSVSSSNSNKMFPNIAVHLTQHKPPTPNDGYARRIVFVRCGETEGKVLTAPLAKIGQVASEKSAADLKALRLNFSAVVCAPHLRCVQTMKLFYAAVRETSPGAQLGVEFGLAENFDTKLTLLEDPKPALTELGVPANYQTSVPVAAVNKQDTLTLFCTRVSKTVKDIVAKVPGNVLFVCDVFAIDCAVRSLLELPNFTERDQNYVDIKYPNSSMVIVDQAVASPKWSLQHSFVPFIIQKRNTMVDINFVKRAI